MSKKEEFIKLQNRDARNFSLCLTLIMLFIVVTANVLSIKEPIEMRVPFIGTFFHLIEWGMLGYFDYRSVYLNRQRKKFSLSSILIVALMWCVNVGVYHLIAERMADRAVTPVLMAQFAVFFCVGVVVKITKIRLRELKQKMTGDPAHQRNTWQRVFYFYPPLVLTVMAIALSWLIDPKTPDFYLPLLSLNFVVYFLMGVTGFRAIAWECWWRPPHHKKWIWGLGIISMIFVVFIRSGIFFVFNADKTLFFTALVNGTALGLSLFLYLAGFSVVANSESQKKSKKKPFYMKASLSHDDHEKCS